MTDESATSAPKPPSLRAHLRLVRRLGYVLALLLSISTLSVLDALAGLVNASLAAFGAEDASDLYDGFTRYAPLTLSVVFAELTALTIAAPLLRKRADSRTSAGSALPTRRRAEVEKKEHSGSHILLWCIAIYLLSALTIFVLVAALVGLFMVGQRATEF